MGKISKLLRCCFDPTFGGEEKHRYATVHFEFLVLAVALKIYVLEYMASCGMANSWMVTVCQSTRHHIPEGFYLHF